MRSFSLKWLLLTTTCFAGVLGVAVRWPVTEYEVRPTPESLAQVSAMRTEARRQGRPAPRFVKLNYAPVVSSHPPSVEDLTIRVARAYITLIAIIGAYAAVLYLTSRRKPADGDGLLHILPGDAIGGPLQRRPSHASSSRRWK